jgi:alkylhydroperoxidase family enzyme
MAGVTDKEAGWIARLVFQGVRRRVGRVTDTFRIAAHAPGLLLGWALHELAFERASTVDRRLRTLAQLKTAVLIGCPG